MNETTQKIPVDAFLKEAAKELGCSLALDDERARIEQRRKDKRKKEKKLNRHCKTCGKVLTKEQTKYCSIKCKLKENKIKHCGQISRWGKDHRKNRER